MTSERERAELSEAQVSSEQYKCAIEAFNEEIAEWKPRAEKAEARVAEWREILLECKDELTALCNGAGVYNQTHGIRKRVEAALSAEEKS